MKNKFILIVFAILSACGLGDKDLGVVNKKRSQRELDRLQAAKEDRDRLKNGDWSELDNDIKVKVEKTNKESGYIYRFEGLKIENGARKPVTRDKTLELDFGTFFQKSNGHEISEDSEIKDRVDALKALQNSTKVGDLPLAQQKIIKSLKTGITNETTFREIFDTDEKYNILMGLLDKGKSGVQGHGSGKVTATYKEQNQLEQYRKRLDLKYVDFGSWNRSFSLSGLDRNWEDLIKKSGKVNPYKEYFAMGDDKHKITFAAGDTAKENLTFTGKTFASVTRGQETEDGLYGDVKLSISQGQTTGRLDLSFARWYKFSLDKLNINNFTPNAGSNWSISENDNFNGFKFKNDATKKVKDVTIKGAFFGEGGKPEEIVGTYKFTAENSGEDFKIKGSFGAKK